MSATVTTPRFQIESLSWTKAEPDYRPSCVGCGWSWAPGREDDPLVTRAAAASFARGVHRVCPRRAVAA